MNVQFIRDRIGASQFGPTLAALLLAVARHLDTLSRVKKVDSLMSSGSKFLPLKRFRTVHSHFHFPECSNIMHAVFHLHVWVIFRSQRPDLWVPNYMLHLPCNLRKFSNSASSSSCLESAFPSAANRAAPDWSANRLLPLWPRSPLSAKFHGRSLEFSRELLRRLLPPFCHSSPFTWPRMVHFHSNQSACPGSRLR